MGSPQNHKFIKTEKLLIEVDKIMKKGPNKPFINEPISTKQKNSRQGISLSQLDFAFADESSQNHSVHFSQRSAKALDYQMNAS